MKLFLSLVMVFMGFGLTLAAACLEGHISCEEAARLSGAAKIMGDMTGTPTPSILSCEEAPSS